jgi:signal transduction histidine kinase
MLLVPVWPLWLSRTSLQVRLALVFAVAFLFVFGVFAIAGMRVLDKSTQRILQQRQVIAMMAAQHYDEILMQAFSELEMPTTVARFDPSAANLESESLLLKYALNRVNIFSLGMQFLDAQGRVVLATPDGAAPGTDESALPYIAQVIRTGQRSISKPFRDPYTRKPAVALTIPVLDAAGRVVSLLSGRIDLSGPALTSPLAQANSRGLADLAELVDEDATVLVSTEVDMAPLLPSDHQQFILRMLAAAQPGVEDILDEYGPHAGEAHVMAFASLKAAHWGVAIGDSESDTFADVRELQLDIFVIGTLSFVSIFALALWVSRSLVQPVRALTGAAQRIERGDLSSPLRLSGGGEIGALVTSFESMRIRLLQSDAESSEWRSELERRVQERTKELARLNDELTQSEGVRSQLLERVINVQEEERKRLARDLHDDFAQTLTALSVTIQAVKHSIPTEMQGLQQQLDSLQSLVSNTLDQVGRWIQDLRPRMLDDLGLVPAIRSYAESRLEPAGTRVQVEASGLKRRLPPQIELTLFRVVQEAVSNIARHAHARTAQIRFDLYDGGQIVAHVEDDGDGFIPAKYLHAQDGMQGIGLLGMRERIAALGGTLTIDSTPRRGTRIRAEVPYRETTA